MRKVLIVDDNADILMVVDLILSQSFSVATLDNGQAIFEKVRTFEPDLILLDISLGDEDGRKICKLIKSDDATKHIQVILFTGHEKFTHRISDCMADGFIAKPFEVKNLIHKIHACLEDSIINL